MSRTIKFIIPFLAIVFFLVFVIAKAVIPDFESTVEAVTEPKVYITESGGRYHSGNCHYLKYSKRAMGVHEAIGEGYSACVYCGGRSSETVLVEYEKEIPKNDIEESLCIAFAVKCQ